MAGALRCVNPAAFGGAQDGRVRLDLVKTKAVEFDSIHRLQANVSIIRPYHAIPALWSSSKLNWGNGDMERM